MNTNLFYIRADNSYLKEVTNSLATCIWGANIVWFYNWRHHIPKKYLGIPSDSFKILRTKELP